MTLRKGISFITEVNNDVDLLVGRLEYGKMFGLNYQVGL